MVTRKFSFPFLVPCTSVTSVLNKMLVVLVSKSHTFCTHVLLCKLKLFLATRGSDFLSVLLQKERGRKSGNNGSEVSCPQGKYNAGKSYSVNQGEMGMGKHEGLVCIAYSNLLTVFFCLKTQNFMHESKTNARLLPLLLSWTFHATFVDAEGFTTIRENIKYIYRIAPCTPKDEL